MTNMTLADLLRYMQLRLAQWLEETEGKESDPTAGIEHEKYLVDALHALLEALEYYQDWQLEQVHYRIERALYDTQMGARFKGEYALTTLPGLIDAIDKRSATHNGASTPENPL